MDSSLRNRLKIHIENYRHQLHAKIGEKNESFKHIPYGTAGFRGEACQIEHLFFNIGILSGIRALDLGANVGVMITASHNPIQDNGVKLIDSHGEMLDAAWESIAEDFCNNQEVESLLDYIQRLITRYEIDVKTKKSCCVCIGMDTRPSSEALAGLVKQGLDIWSDVIGYHDYGVLTTPAIHYLVAVSNKQPLNNLIKLEDYYNQLIGALADSGYSYQESAQKLCVDCANGVGAETMIFLFNDSRFKKLIPNLKLINHGNGILNKDCGADFVKTQGKPPEECYFESNTRYASLDGDADRLVYFYLEPSVEADSESRLHLLDGDRILSLYAVYLSDQMARCNLLDRLSLGIIQTPYANGASTLYLTQKLGLRVDFTDTGVKNLHRKALEYDLAVYFEANGHGTIHVSDKAITTILAEYERTKDDNLGHLKHLLETLNNYTGDAIADLILAEVLLQYYGWDIEIWHKIYDDLPNSLIKLQVSDKNLIKTIEAGQICVEPKEIQPAIDGIVKKYGDSARCFVRPSGTENVVRIYAEAKTQEESDNLAEEVKANIANLFNKFS